MVKPGIDPGFLAFHALNYTDNELAVELFYLNKKAVFYLLLKKRPTLLFPANSEEIAKIINSCFTVLV